ncbi:hypothetical protein BH23CHL10_BH23CHL10_10160 [soil metagenome]
MNPLKALRDMRTIGRLLTDAEQIARRMGDERPSAEHLLISAIGLPDGSAGTVFAPSTSTARASRQRCAQSTLPAWWPRGSHPRRQRA